MNGKTDSPITKMHEDLFDVKSYIEGLSTFIRQCYTPMTIAIQGDWGSGKTSIMNMVRENLDLQVVWFNTWQYSQFRMGEELPVALLSSLLDELFSAKDDMAKYEIVGKMKKNFRTIKKQLRSTVVAMADTVNAGKIAEAAINLVDDETSIVQVISQLKEQFQECIDKICEIKCKDRIVIFIDDLDRLYPEQAVELLEVLKVFLDCEKCVFVLAIDYEVVSQGVRKKFGDKIGIEKGRSFFDKIIQVPFKMPVAQYDIKPFVSDTLKILGIPMAADSSEMDSYIGLISTSIGRNPRSIKRLFNTFTLLKNMPNIADMKDVWTLKMLFAILCLQLSFEECFNYIIELGDSLDDNFFRSLIAEERDNVEDESVDSDEDEKLLKIYECTMKKLKYDEDRQTALIQFMKYFSEVIDSDGDGDISKKELEAFRDVLYFSAITATGNATTPPKSAKSNRYAKEYDKEATYSTLEQDKDISWQSARFEEIHFRDQSLEKNNLASYMDFILGILWKENPKKMEGIINSPKDFGVGAFFKKDKYDVPHEIPGTKFQFETKNGANNKRDFFVRVLAAYDIPIENLKIKRRLAMRK